MSSSNKMKDLKAPMPGLVLDVLFSPPRMHCILCLFKIVVYCCMAATIKRESLNSQIWTHCILYLLRSVMEVDTDNDNGAAGSERTGRKKRPWIIPHDVICAFVVKWALVMATGSLASARIEVHSNPVDELARGRRFSRKGCIGGTMVKHRPYRASIGIRTD